MSLTFYDQAGAAIAYVEQDGAIHLYSGQPVAWLDGRTNVYDYAGQHLGVFKDGWVRDHRGDCVYFTDNASGGPIRPIRAIRPVRGVRGIRPVRGVPQVPPVPAVPSLGWSSFTGPAFFLQP